MSTIKFTVDKIGRKWLQITVHGKRSNYKAKTAKESFPDAETGKEYEREGNIEAESNKFGSTYTLVLQNTQDNDWVTRDIQKYIGIIRKRYTESGYIYENGVYTLHRLGCTDYDEEIQQMRIEIIRKRFRDEGYVYEKGVAALHQAGCRSYDQEIQQMRDTVAERKAAERAARKKEQKEADRAAGIRELRIPAHWGFSGKPRAGSTMMEKGVPYRVISSYYHDSDGFSFGVMNEEWYSVRAQDISGTSEGRMMIAMNEADKALVDAKQALALSYDNLSAAIRERGERYAGDTMDTPKGETIYDTMDGYGYGYAVITCDDGLCWLICNNGADGDNWGFNNIRTGGAGAYGYFCKTELVAEEISAVSQRRASVEAAKNNRHDLESESSSPLT